MVCSNDSECLQKNSRCVSYNRQKNKRWRCLCNHHTEYDAATRSCETRKIIWHLLRIVGNTVVTQTLHYVKASHRYSVVILTFSGPVQHFCLETELRSPRGKSAWGMSHLPLSFTNRLNQTESAAFKLWMLHVQSIFFQII